MSSALSAPITIRSGLNKAVLADRDEWFFELALFGVGILDSFNIRVMGQLLFSDLFIPAFFIAAIFVRGIPPRRAIYLALAGMLLWMAALIGADAINQTAPENYLRGWSRNGLAILYFVFFVSALRPTPRSFGMLACGLAIGLMIQPFLYWGSTPDIVMKFGGHTAGSWLLCIFSSLSWRAKRPLLPILCVVAWIGVTLSQNVRSAAVMNFILAALMAASYYGHGYFRRVGLPALFAIVVVSGAIAGFAFSSGYDYLVTSGVLGQAAMRKHEIQSRGGGALLEIWNARPEMRVATAVVSDSPILGHGSWYTNPRIVAAELLFSTYATSDAGSGGSPEALKAFVIRSGGKQAAGHSALLQAWVEAGIIGAFFWLTAISICLMGILRSLQRPNILSPFLFYGAVTFIWDALFSPFAGAQRVSNMAEFAMVLVAMPVTERIAKKVLAVRQEKAPEGGS